MDNGQVHFVDTAFGGETMPQTCLEKSGARSEHEFPRARKEFASHLNGTDAYDNMTANRKGFACIAFNLRTTKWTVRLGFDAMGDILHANGW